jgi:RNA polymerase sigma-70 factor (ECF subfamily)
VSRPERDEDLVERSRAGDREAFTELVRRHEGRIYGLCLRILGDADDARDAAQDTFLTAYRKLGQFRGDARFTTWLHRIGVNCCYDALRRARRQPMLHAVNDETVPELGPPAEDHADDVAGTLDAAAALARLPEEYRVVLVLADIQDLPYDEISKVLDVPVGTVKSRVHRGRIALAKALGLGRGDPRTPSVPDPSTPAGEPAGRTSASEEEP